jgi:hypothetical protein
MEKIAELLEKLAVKFGTTVEHLWEVMLRQAPISGVVDLGIDVILITFSILAFKFIRGKTATHEFGEEGWTRIEAEWEDEAAFWAWSGFIMMCIIISVVTLGSITSIVAAFFNPEYWALTKILSLK